MGSDRTPVDPGSIDSASRLAPNPRRRLGATQSEAKTRGFEVLALG